MTRDEIACSCITCSDEAIPMTVITVDDASGLATCADGEVEIALIDPVVPGDRILVHAGTAIAKLEGAAA